MEYSNDKSEHGKDRSAKMLESVFLQVLLQYNIHTIRHNNWYSTADKCGLKMNLGHTNKNANDLKIC